MPKIVINVKHGGFGLSTEAMLLYGIRANLKMRFRKTDTIGAIMMYTVNGESFSSYDIPRDDPLLIEIVEQLGERANDDWSCLAVIEIPDDVEDWYIEENEGLETIHEVHRQWGHREHH